jgi:hypothetical protein
MHPHATLVPVDCFPVLVDGPQVVGHVIVRESLHARNLRRLVHEEGDAADLPNQQPSGTAGRTTEAASESTKIPGFQLYPWTEQHKERGRSQTGLPDSLEDW